tara:strand:- start:234 stop:533 length:300 start_codon:yes stop_codon:yes gene_type:complete
MAKEANQQKPSDEILNQMEAFNGNPAMRVTEKLSPEGTLLEKQVEIYPRAASHVEYTVDSKGTVKPTVKVYHEKADEAFMVATDLMARAMVEADKLSKN